MLDFDKVFKWLNYDVESFLSPADKISIIQISDLKTAKAIKEAAVKILRLQVEAGAYDLEKAELCAWLGKYYFREGNHAMAIIYLEESGKLYEKNPHRYAVINFLLGIINWKIRENIIAHAKWSVGIDIFDTLRDQNMKAKAPGIVIWYDENIELVKIEMIQTVEEAYEWLNKWEPPALGKHAKMYIQEIENRILNHEYPPAYDVGMGLIRVSRFRLNPMESAEASVVIGLKYHRMGQSKLAADYFLRAGASFTPGHYHQAVTKWMLGIAQWELRYEKDNAFKSWRESIELLEEVMDQTDRINDQEKRGWLENLIPLMKKSLEIKTQEYFSGV